MTDLVLPAPFLAVDLLGLSRLAFLVLKMPWVTGWWCNNHLEKYEFVNGNDYPIYHGKIIQMFQTTN
jgi:hypothetical protein